MFDLNLNRSNILAFANHMESLDPALYDQTRDVHDNGQFVMSSGALDRVFRAGDLGGNHASSQPAFHARGG